MTTKFVRPIAPRIHSHLRLLLLLPLATLLGCTLPYTPSPLSGNWQIQAGTAITSPPTSPYLVGALQGDNSALTGTFNVQPGGSGATSQVLFTGTYNPAAANLVLTGSPVQGVGIGVMLSVPVDPTDLATGSIDFDCLVCALRSLPIPVVGVEIAPLNGTYTGTLTDSASPGMSGTGSLTLTQSTTPNADGSFSLTGTLTFPSNSGFGTFPLSGTVSGEGITLYDPTPGIVPVVSLTASTNPAATQITVSNLAFAVTASDIVTFTGTLTLQ